MSVPSEDTTECTDQGLGIEPRRFEERAKHALDCCSPYLTIHVH
jgi:hypothetical protein